MKNVTSLFRLDEVDSSELRALISSEFSTSSHNPDTETGAPHEVIYGNSELVLTYKSGTDIIREIRVSNEFPKVHLDKIKENVLKYLILGEGTLDYPTTTLFTFGQHSIAFKYLDEFQIFPAPDSSPYPNELSAEFPIVLQYSYLKTGNIAIDSVRSSKIRNEISLLLTGLFPSIFNHSIADTTSNIKKHWVYKPNNDTSTLSSEWCQTGYPSPKFDSSNFKDIRLSIPHFSRIKQLKEGVADFYKLNQNDKTVITRACYWCHKGIISNCNTDKLLNLIIMIESLSPNESECDCGTMVSHKDNLCPNCQKCVSGITKSFAKFAKTYSGIDDEPFFKMLYRFRSNIAHSGLTLNGDDKGFQYGFVPNSLLESQSVNSLINICSIIIRNYIKHKAEL